MYYNKPMVLLNDDFAEGVYMASGGRAGESSSDCWTIDVPSVQDWNGSHHVFEPHCVHSNAMEHISTAITVSVTFNHTVTDAYSENGWECTVNGSTVTVTRPSHANAYKSGDNVTFKIWAQTADEATTKALAVVGKSISCTKSVNVQGGGADGN